MLSCSFKAKDFRSLTWLIIIVGLATLSVSGRLRASSQSPHPARSASSESQIARGKYIVEGVAMCGMCHTPRTDSGEVDSGRSLEGAAVWLMPAHPTGNWPLKAPRIAGTPPASDDDMVRLFMTGIWTDGNRLRPPMPQFRMSREDAESVVAYLRSLRPGPGD
ncbi:MAG TPA: c-type cytochrome [Candidatus Binatia bacterium]|nr:c-type cytochrome [Candidatus Binatia bacterium]